MKIKILIQLFLFTISFSAWSFPDWSRNVEITEPRSNIYDLPEGELQEKILQGRKHALFYPVQISDLLVPHRPIREFFETDPEDPVRRLLFGMARVMTPYKSLDEVYVWLGLHDYPKTPQMETPNAFPELSREEMQYPMGISIFETRGAEALTVGCAACHSSDLFGVKVIGLTNRFPRANELFNKVSTLAPYVNTFVLKKLLKTTEEEREMLARAKMAIKYAGFRNPQVLGLDTSLAQVALSLAKREQDPYATRSENSYKKPRPNKLEKMVSDSKPAVWWNVKYKNRWLSDGSVVSGNPIHTNFLWNEIGRGTDLKNLEQWMAKNQQVIEDLTASVFAATSPRFEEFFGVESINLEKAKRGQKHFVQSCQKCHGTYEKGWDQPHALSLTNKELLQTIKVTYHKQTPVRDVGTDPGRYLGMREFADDLNRLAISQAIKTIVEPQKGYVPPPLDGIWSRWPYFHNNSIPNLCVLLTKSSERPKTYWAGAAVDKKTDFDQECVGYPLGNKTPVAWTKNKELFYDTNREGMRNTGHDERIFLQDGKEIYTQAQKLELIEFLKTL